ncbi:MAG: hypothetical protein M3R35_01615 [Candidatus Eremiobacteraeota bacterium]|nr:hypothetical protein [Candidatus Eremiobacteraeota bacterium]
MRPLPTLAAVLLLAAVPAATARTILTVAASALLEATPFILAGAGLAAVSNRWARVVPYLGCGCGSGPSARSLPAAAASWLVFGPLVAGARLAAAILVARCSTRRATNCSQHPSSALADLHALLPVAAAAAGMLWAFSLRGSLSHWPGPAAFLLGAVSAFIAAPCAIGAVGLASALRAGAPMAAVGFLCVAGICDVRALTARHHRASAHDGVAYALAAVASALVAWRGGDALVHPRFTIPLWICALAFAALAARHRNARAGFARWAPAIMLAGAIIGAPAPTYHATETTLAEAFAGERIDFTGEVTYAAGSAALVRYAITCCRADAAPITIRLQSPPHPLHGWIRARGTLVSSPAGLALHADHYEELPTPTDPFVYR